MKHRSTRVATSARGAESALALIQMRAVTIARIDAALDRTDAGTYGRCLERTGFRLFVELQSTTGRPRPSDTCRWHTSSSRSR